MYTANITVKLIVKLCKYPVVYLDGKTRVENNKSKLKKKQRDSTGASPILSWPGSSSFLPVPLTEISIKGMALLWCFRLH